MDSEGSTQLADTRPQFDTALRVALPVNIPQRTGKISRDNLIRSNAFTPGALRFGKTALTAVSAKTLPPVESTASSNSDQEAQIKTAVRDFTTLAFSSKRAGKRDVEATAYLSLGVICDNQGNFLGGIENYKLYLQICEEISDFVGCACACNCLGVNFMMLASPPSDAGILQGVKQTSAAGDYLSQAVFYHGKHLEIGPDSGGRFVANTNLGLCLGMLGDVVQSAKHQQDALRIAIKMQTLYGQSISVGNLGMLAVSKEDFVTARTCFEQHLQLVQALADPEAEVNAWKILAKVCTSEEKYADALEQLEEARKIASREGYLNELRRIHCLIGIARGLMDFPDFLGKVLLQSKQSEENVALGEKS